MNVKIDWIENDIIVSFWGKLRFEDIYEINGKIYGDARFDKMDYQIADFSKVEGFIVENFTPEITAKLFSNLDKNAMYWNVEIKVAMVKSKYPELNQFLEVYKEAMQETKWESRIFNTLEEAQAWVKS